MKLSRKTSKKHSKNISKKHSKKHSKNTLKKHSKKHSKKTYNLFGFLKPLTEDEKCQKNFEKKYENPDKKVFVYDSFKQYGQGAGSKYKTTCRNEKDDKDTFTYVD